MNYLQLKKIKKLYFGSHEIARVLNISEDSARVACTRLVKRGILIRLKRGIYLLRDRWEVMDREDRYVIANVIQTPSYVSLMSALDYYEITTQMQRDFTESISLYRTKEINVEKTVFSYTRIKKLLYRNFVKANGFFIATPEKAFLDAFYLFSLKRYSFDLSSVDVGRLDKVLLSNISSNYPEHTKKLLKRYELV